MRNFSVTIDDIEKLRSEVIGTFYTRKEFEWFWDRKYTPNQNENELIMERYRAQFEKIDEQTNLFLLKHQKHEVQFEKDTMKFIENKKTFTELKNLI